MKALWIVVAMLALHSVSAAEPDRRIGLEPCHIRDHVQEVLCGTHTVFENRSTAQGRRIDLHFAVIPAIDETVEPDPIVMFAGGPGQAALDMAAFSTSVFSRGE